ncbi:hypothetical protein [Levilactobacillus zymae]|uniref:Uncharacterized protein n=1 Tax=Levilactobacillus zymae TaxID=267363 RepID=A0A1Y6JV72_9LACO|nr:hypothetical protein [Levilactobacillus zymae]SMS13829.1 hypothetical protein LZ3411_0779 [Levilactobacillus zymae]
MKITWKRVILSLALVGVGGLLGLAPTLTPQAAVRMHKLTTLPQTYRGTWYVTVNGKTHKLKVTGNRFGISTYRKHQNNGMSATSEHYFQPYRVSGARAKTLYLKNYSGIQTIRRTTLKGQPVLVQYDEQEHASQLIVWTKTKRSRAQRSWGAGNPYGMSVTSVKTAKANRRDYAKINPFLKRTFGHALTKKVYRGNGKFKGINVVNYTAISHL